MTTDPVQTAFALLARLRNAPAVHPRAQSFDGSLTIEPTGWPLPAGSHRTLVKFSKGAGTPGALPDVLGIALRVELAEGRWDVLFSSSGDGRLTRWIPHPARSWTSATYCTLSPYAAGDRRFWLLLAPVGTTPSRPPVVEKPPTEFTLSVAGRTGPWTAIGRLTVGAARPDRPAIDPVLNHPEDLDLAPAWLRNLRELAYAGSRRGRRTGVERTS